MRLWKRDRRVVPTSDFAWRDDGHGLYVVVTHHERVGSDWIECRYCGCKYPPDQQCPYQEYHDDPTAIWPDGKPTP